MRALWRWLLAAFRLDLGAVCEASKGRPLDNDFHTWRDADTADTLEPLHRCRRCGKTFVF
jgi:hypothetical protein